MATKKEERALANVPIILMVEILDLVYIIPVRGRARIARRNGVARAMY